MKSKELKAFQNLILRQVTAYLKNYTLLKPQEVTKIFSSQKFHGSTLYWILFCSDRKHSPSKTLIDSLVALEITFKAGLIHETIKEDITNFPSTTPPGEQAVLLKNTRKILLGDMLIATAINIVNSIQNSQLQKEFYIWAQSFFLKRVEIFIPQSLKKPKPQKTTWSWISILAKLSKKEKKPQPQKRVSSIIRLLSQSPYRNPEKIEKGIQQVTGLITEILGTKQSSRSINNLPSKESELTFWLKQELLNPSPN